MDKNHERKSTDSSKNSSSGVPDPSSVLDAASLFAYWGRDPSALPFGSFNNNGMGMIGAAPGVSSNSYDRHAAAAAAAHHNSTIAVAASQAASLAGLHSNWYTMAQLAAQDYFTRLQASGMSHLVHPDMAGFPGLSPLPNSSVPLSGIQKLSSSTSGNNSNKASTKKRDKTSNSDNMNYNTYQQKNHSNVNISRDNEKNSSSSSSSSYKTIPNSKNDLYNQSIYNQANLHKELLAAAASLAGNDSYSQFASQSKNKMPTNFSSYSPTSHNSSNNKLSGKTSSTSQRNQPQSMIQSMNLGHNKSSLSKPEINLSPTHSQNSLAQYGLSSSQNMKSMSNSPKLSDYMNAASGLISDSPLMGVRLPPDTEIIKYTSSVVGPKVPGATNRGRKKTISLDPNPFLANMQGLNNSVKGDRHFEAAGPQPSLKRQKMDSDFTSQINSGNRVEVIKLPVNYSSNGQYSSKSASIEVDDSDWESSGGGGLNLSTTSKEKSRSEFKNNSIEGDAPLNLSLKMSNETPTLKSTPNKPSILDSMIENTELSNNVQVSNLNSLQSLSSITAGIGSNENKTHYKEGRPRNLGRGVSKPKKNTVASLLAQSRAVGGAKPMFTQQLLAQGTDLEKIRQAIVEASQQNSYELQSNTDSESINDASGLSESEGELDSFNIDDLKMPIEMGWRRETIIRGLTKTGQLKGDVCYYSPNNPETKLKNLSQIYEELADTTTTLNNENFSFSARVLVGTYLQAAPAPYATEGDFVRMSDSEVAQRLEEIRTYTRQSLTPLNVEQRIEIARQQQAIRDAKKMAKEESFKSKEKTKYSKENDRSERLEQQRKERELKSLQQTEVKRKRDEEVAKQKVEEQKRKQEEKEIKRQQALIFKEQVYLQDLNKQKEYLYNIELERERRRQHIALMKQLETRRKYEEREKKRHQFVLEKLISREKRLSARKLDSKILAELRKPQEDSEILNQKDLLSIPRIGGLKLTGQGFADLLMSFEFLHNFGETLGFDMDSLPSLQSLHNALSSENAVDAEDEFLSVLTHLIVCAIEDPGIPNPNRHTTLLGQTLRQADITHQNVSEILRIYLYAVASGEVRQQSGINFERERCGRFGDLHQNDNEERISNINSKNSQFYVFLHENERYKLSECLKDKPYVSLNPTVKSQILAMLCNDLLLNKAVCRQIETNLESQAQLKKEKFVLDNKVRKYKSLVTRKIRNEQYERAQQAIKAENDQHAQEKQVLDQENQEQPKTDTEETNTISNNTPILADEQNESIEKPELQENIIEKETVKCVTNLSFSLNDLSQLSNTNISINPIDLGLTAEKIDDDNSDVESEETQLEEDEDANISSEEAQKKLEKILENSFQTKQHLQKSLNSLRAKHYGQDRFWRRYWYLPKCGGIFVEGLESAQSDILKYQTKLEETYSLKGNLPREIDEDGKQCANGLQQDENLENKSFDAATEDFSINSIKQIKENTKIESFEKPEVINETAPNKCTEQIQQHYQAKLSKSRNQIEENDFDIEDSIPTAILVQKENKTDDSKFVEINHVVPSNNNQSFEEDNRKNTMGAVTDYMNESNQFAEDSQKIDSDNTNDGTKINVKNESDFRNGDETKEKEYLMPKWFSLINKQDPPLFTSDCPLFQHKLMAYQNIQCKDSSLIYGHQWEIQNNLGFYNTHSGEKVLNENFKHKTILSTSGLNETLLQDIYTKEEMEDSNEDEMKPMLLEKFNMSANCDDQQTHFFSLPTFVNMSINNLSVYVQCDNNTTPLQMTPEEQQAVEEFKISGTFKKNTNPSFAGKDLRHGWWKISEIDDMNCLIKNLHVKGLREKNLRQSLLSALTESIDLTIQCPLSNPRAPPPTSGFVEPVAFNAWNPRIAKRVEQTLLDQVEAMEDKIANASMQIKGWIVPQRDNDSESEILETIDINLIRDRILNLEGAIERRYLKPPLGNNTAEAQLAAMAHETVSQSNNNGNNSSSDAENATKGLLSWRDAVQRSVTSAQLSMALYTLEQCVAWDKSIMKANCQFCQSGESEDKLLLCDGCDRGYHTYCFKPKMENIPEGDWFCYECLNKATGDRKCIVCGGNRMPPVGKLMYCELCPRVFHHDCSIPPMLKVPRGKWYCSNCVTKAPPKKRAPRKPKELKTHNSSHSLNSSHDDALPLSPTASVASYSFDEQMAPSSNIILGLGVCGSPKPIETSSRPLTPIQPASPTNAPEHSQVSPVIPTPTITSPASPVEQTVETKDYAACNNEDECAINTVESLPLKDVHREKEESKEKIKAEKKAAKKLSKELSICKVILEEMEVHEDSWPFLLPVNTKQFPTYKKVISYPMDLSTIKKRLQDLMYKARDDFVSDVRQIFDNCEVFNEDDSPVGKAGHGMRKYFELRWAELTDKHS